MDDDAADTVEGADEDEDSPMENPTDEYNSLRPTHRSYPVSDYGVSEG